ncbi:hypothetical protein G5714_020857 [Onychostoma macrolepis]|uniref:Uncharacterized protein n=1 Tax=Onychostoma macrolepis TaxID=369639 RepID=A0A7J6BV09_9TELE|nr:hypothetical protein G5714_020857 [Onychostoma macrolepis]
MFRTLAAHRRGFSLPARPSLHDHPFRSSSARAGASLDFSGRCLTNFPPPLCLAGFGEAGLIFAVQLDYILAS